MQMSKFVTKRKTVWATRFIEDKFLDYKDVFEYEFYLSKKFSNETINKYKAVKINRDTVRVFDGDWLVYDNGVLVSVLSDSSFNEKYEKLDEI